ncbi:hypothetical protein KCP69_20395 [Salmonella enterica subsp. enterica]|nr:hypothetical protein KCP69_20395 [Salmonella enterica subsp. enterica]
MGARTRALADFKSGRYSRAGGDGWLRRGLDMLKSRRNAVNWRTPNAGRLCATVLPYRRQLAMRCRSVLG